MRTGLLWLVALSLLAAASIGEAQTLGRLFTSPTQRAQLERLRTQLPSSSETALEPLVEETEPEPAVLDEVASIAPDIVYSLGGALTRSNGAVYVWINNELVDKESLPANMELLQPYARGQVRISDPSHNRTFVVKPGQTLNLTTGQLSEAYEIRQPPPVQAPDAASVPVSGSDNL